MNARPPKIESREKFEQLARAYHYPVHTYAEAAIFDTELRRQRIGFVPMHLRRDWYHVS